jgi:dGTPase
MMQELIASSGPENGEFRLCMGEPIYNAMAVLRQFLYEKVYRSPSVHEEFIKAKKVLKELYHYLLQNIDILQKELMKMEMAPWDPGLNPLERSVCDLIASMTDRYALDLYARIFFPKPHF